MRSFEKLYNICRNRTKPKKHNNMEKIINYGKVISYDEFESKYKPIQNHLVEDAHSNKALWENQVAYYTGRFREALNRIS